MAVVLKGKEVADVKKAGVKERVEVLKSKGVNPTLSIVMVGNREDSLAYAQGAKKALSSCGIGCRIDRFPESISQEEFIENIERINADNGVHGILIMRPLPNSIEWDQVQRAVMPEKDVDCITTYNLGRVFEGRKDVFYPCTARAVMDILDYYRVELQGKKAVVVGRSLVVGRPVAVMLLQKNATVTVCHSKTANLPEVTSRGDILVAAVGVPQMVKKEHVKQGAVVIDVGINVVGGKLVGDVDYYEVSQVAGMITPVPGGVGSVTTAVLMEHVVTAAEKLHKKNR